MGEITSQFLESSFPVANNGIKAVIFKLAELLMSVFILKFFTLAAARSSYFTAYLMFFEDLIQRFFFLTSRGLSRASVLVLVFTILNTLATLYGTLLWSLDFPGYVFNPSNSTLAAHRSALNPDSPYIVRLQLGPDTLDSLGDKTLRHAVGAELFRPGYNISLSGDVQRGRPEPVQPLVRDLRKAGARIWLDADGFSVSADSYAQMPGALLEVDGHEFPYECVIYQDGAAEWNCTFHNLFAFEFMRSVLGKPEVHWDAASSANYESKYISPSRIDNVWAIYGQGAGSTMMMQVFTVTKGNRRHTFAETVRRATMLTTPGIPFAAGEVQDLVRRFDAAGRSETDRGDPPMLDRIVTDLLRAQQNRTSYNFGANFVAGNGTNGAATTVIQNSWSFLTPKTTASAEEIYSVVYITSTNITLIRSENIDNPPAPLGGCSQPFMNLAYGGKVTQTDCVAPTISTEGVRFYGTVDTSAVMILYGFGAGRSNISAESLDQKVVDWARANSPKLTNLLVARAFAADVDQSGLLVSVTVDNLIAALSGLQLLLCLLPPVLVFAVWLALVFWVEENWSKSFLANLINSTLYAGTPQSESLYMKRPPNVDMIAHEEGIHIVIEGRPVFLGKYIPYHKVTYPPTNLFMGNAYAGIKTESR
ncbi:hypothetical protein QBC42DRAFT_308974 [Cladorrhinum samala]|uniref:Transmembrane protein n=1 Tax=Cladorrhinum samala TaxID=585594 RepID=A0AAV9HDJ5_9PEZI|nr:hypothetical protein QBC42DRAFT_308974 [Cladorrhinum samala]